jgi:hypothetical protein
MSHICIVGTIGVRVRVRVRWLFVGVEVVSRGWWVVSGVVLVEAAEGRPGVFIAAASGGPGWGV